MPKSPLLFALPLFALACALPSRGVAQTDTTGIWETLFTGPDGTRIAVDSAVLGRLDADSTFFVRTGSFLAQPVVLEGGLRVDQEIVIQHLDCRAPRVWGIVSQLFSGDTLVEVRPLSERWEELPPERRPGWEVLCARALRNYAPRPPAPEGNHRRVREDQPVLGDFGAVQDAMRRNYPARLYRQRVAGDARVHFRVLADGSVDRRRIDVYSATPGFADAARRVVATMRFRPGRVGGRPVPVWVQLPVHFAP